MLCLFTDNRFSATWYHTRDISPEIILYWILFSRYDLLRDIFLRRLNTCLWPIAKQNDYTNFGTFNVRYNAITTVVTVTIRRFVMQNNNVFYCIGVGINIGKYLYASATFLYAEFKVYDNAIKTKMCSLYNIHNNYDEP